MSDVEPDPRVLRVLRKLGYSHFQVRYGKVHARRDRDHLIIKLSRKGIPRTGKPGLISAHQNLKTKTPPYHRADFSEQEKLIKEFVRAWMKEIKGNG